MKILFISPSPPDYLGGLSLFIKGLTKKLGENEIKVDILSSSLTMNKDTYELYSKNVKLIKKKCYLLADNKNILRIKNPIFNVISYLIKYRKNYDLIHVHSYIYFSTMQTLFLKRLVRDKIPVILHLHGGIQTSSFQGSNFIEKLMLLFKKYFFDLTIGKILISSANALISVAKDDLLAVNSVFRTKRVKDNYYIPNALDLNTFKKDKSLERKYIGFIGRLTKIKGIDYFLKLIERFQHIDKDQEFLIVGDGQYLPHVKKAMKRYPIKFFESVPHDQMPNLYNQCTIFIQTSRAEGLPTCVLEALSCEVPVVASKVGGIQELIQDGVNGYLYESGDVDKAIEQIMLIREKNNYELLGKNGRSLIESKYSWNIIVKKVIEVYRRIISDFNKKI
ncbi:MAG: glycosyltransferase family 4 protein [Candidatus Thorarchaeota archaeon]